MKGLSLWLGLVLVTGCAMVPLPPDARIVPARPWRPLGNSSVLREVAGRRCSGGHDEGNREQIECGGKGKGQL